MEIAMNVICGLGLFIYGMTLMGEGLQKAAGSKLKAIVGALTKSTLRGILVGALVTCLIQSSGATTVMVIGFVNAKIMTLNQAVGVIMGANIGTTITSFIIALNLGQYSPILIAIGTIFYLMGKTRSTKSIGESILGFGLLFLGIMTMEKGLKPLSNNASFVGFMQQLDSPILGMIIGIVATTALQSSSASIGVMQALGMQGLMTIGAAFPMLLGTNIGSTTTAILSSLGAHKTAKRAALIHFLFNLIGSIIFLILFLLFKPWYVAFMDKHITTGLATQIAVSHFAFNLVNTVLFYPFTNLLVKVTEKIIPGNDKDDEPVTIYLDQRILQTPSIAVFQATKEAERMSEMALESLRESEALMTEQGKSANYDSIMDRELIINKMQREITAYLIELSHASLSSEQHKDVDDLFYVVSDIERCGDHIKNIAELYEDIEKDAIVFDEILKDEMKRMFDECAKALETSMKAFVERDIELVNKVFKIEDGVDEMEDEYRAKHIRRLSNKYTDALPGIIFLDCISNLERISDHSNNIANYVQNRIDD
ncbi:MAG: Na/Pi cotransporter family protein [Ezakiella sp.]|nr:Na/Pi cotransporter family protein [Ezakiella sp.]MDD7472049.1 Na/Pi cotransporter family protein [Bacillota bacterium]MDY3924013.1 Na/Pi cotransporter family protein [Ezakiella sp.]